MLIADTGHHRIVAVKANGSLSVVAFRQAGAREVETWWK
jgi:hypothetical protein